ncbi:MAG: hypothetical protein WA867_11280, partial [Candidatus Acidiferrales bacterium]
QYQMTEDFDPPPGVLQETIDPQSGQLATASCPQTVQEYFVSGSEPTQLCELHGGPHLASSPANWLSHLFGKDNNPPPPPNTAANPPNGANPQTPPADDQTEKKKGLLGKIFGIFGSSKKPADSQKPPP